MERNNREILLGLIAAGTLAVALSVGPIPQDPAYHAFADRRALLGWPNFADIASNLPFLLVGIAGLALCARHPRLPARAAWTVMFTGVALVAFGSSWYHLAPDNGTLVWDRLPMALGFIGLFVAVLREYVSERLGRLLWPACGLALGSVGYWRLTDDLRLYAWVQFFPLLSIIVFVLLSRTRRRGERDLAVALAFYLAAKLAELNDAAVFRFSSEWLSGHSLKHLLAASACYVIYRMLGRRVARARPSAPP